MLTMEFYRRNYIEGLFLSSGIVQDPTFTMELLYRTIWLLRNHYHFNGYVHVKAIPGADPELVFSGNTCSTDNGDSVYHFGTGCHLRLS